MMGFGDFVGKYFPIKIFGRNGQRAVDVIFDETTNLHRLAVDQVVKIESLRSFNNIADNWFFINNAPVGESLTIEIDSSDGVFDTLGISVYTKTFTIQPGEDRQDLTDRIVSELNADSQFLQVYRATRVKDSAIVIIKSRFFGEWGEVFTTFPEVKPNAFRILVTGTLNAYPAFTDFIRRNKLNSFSSDPRDERYGQIGVTGSVQIGGSVGNYFQEFFKNNGSDNMSINASVGGPFEFIVPVDPLKDLEIYEVRMFFDGNGIQLGDYFGSTNSPLTNGIIFEFKTDNVVKTLGPFRRNTELKNLFAIGSPENFRLDDVSGQDSLLASFRPGPPIILRKSGTFGSVANDDYLKIILSDRLDNRTVGFKAVAVGFLTDF